MLRRFVSFALLQRKVVARSSAGWIYALITWSFVLLLLGSVWVQFERYVLAPRGAGLYGSAFDRFFQESLDVVGLVFVVAVLLALLVASVAGGEAGLPSGRNLCGLLSEMPPRWGISLAVQQLRRAPRRPG